MITYASPPPGQKRHEKRSWMEDIAFAEKVGMVTIRAGKGNKA
jgi:hypothetical protein